MLPIIVASICAAVSLLLVAGSLCALRRRRLMEDLPTSKTTGVFIGLVELKGTAETETPFIGFLSDERCVHYSWEIEEHYRCSEDKEEKKTIASGGESAPFYLRDEKGVVRIDPDRAEIIAETVLSQTYQTSDPIYYGKGPDTSLEDSMGKRTFTEKVIKLHQPIYVVGQARVREDCVAAEIAYDQLAQMFLISTKPEETLRSEKLWKFWGYGLLAIIAPAICIALFLLCMEDIEGIYLYPWVEIAVGLGVAVIPVWFFGWLWTVYNSLIALRNRLRMAVANVDVELKRRHDLIPRLVSIVDGLRKHERDIQETCTLLRSQMTVQSTSDCQLSQIQGCARQVSMLVENYPELQANGVFLGLQNNLIETEQRIALARNYYNDVIEAYNNRRERFPESMIAILARLRPVSPFVAENFERCVVKVNLAE